MTCNTYYEDQVRLDFNYLQDVGLVQNMPAFQERIE